MIFCGKGKWKKCIFRGSGKENGKEKVQEVALTDNNIRSLNALIRAVVKETGYDWEEVQKVVVNSEVA